MRDIDGTEKILDASNLRSKSSFDEDYEIDGVAVSSISETDLNTQAADIDASLQVARDADDAASIDKLTADKKAIEVELDRRAGKTIERPEGFDVKAALASDIKEFKKKLAK